MKGLEKFSKNLKNKTLQINNALLNLGFETECYCDNCFEITFKTDLFYSRVIVTENIIQFGLRKDFDRWANSVDLTIDIPKTVEVFTGDIESALNKLRTNDEPTK